MGFEDKLHANVFPGSRPIPSRSCRRLMVMSASMSPGIAAGRGPSLIANFSCGEAEILLTHSDNLGQTWSKPRRISVEGDNYFPAISDEVGSPDFVIAYYTNRFDRVFQQSAGRGAVDHRCGVRPGQRRERVTRLSNETEADPLLGGVSIGDYIDVRLLWARPTFTTTPTTGTSGYWAKDSRFRSRTTT